MQVAHGEVVRAGLLEAAPTPQVLHHQQGQQGLGNNDDSQHIYKTTTNLGAV